ncbi:hypothetical protein [Streptomyces sp. V3I7]|uniref:hypothetical protein n=1 Tax=Streptomyces sp. V3I7 TaxID=3042278 RepID=UPI002782E9C6|nr:hypothetical protein [Streptomyces sp. V3I7]MDQ0991768.1 hypothetical protein [Streptomyces sp. V3I7]
MSTAPHRLPRGRAWPRVLVLLLALLVPGARSEVHAAPTPAAAGEIVEYDVLDVALRPPVRPVRHTAVPLRPAPLPTRPPADPPEFRLPAPERSPSTPPALRSVVLRC